MLRRLKKVAYKFLKQTELENAAGDISQDEDSDPPPDDQQAATYFVHNMVQPAYQQPFYWPAQQPALQPAVHTSGRGFYKFPKLKAMIQYKKAGEENKEYLERVWPLVIIYTDNDEAKRLWISDLMGHPCSLGERAQCYYERLMVEYVDDEDECIERPIAEVDRGGSFTKVCHELKAAIHMRRYVKV